MRRRCRLVVVDQHRDGDEQHREDHLGPDLDAKEHGRQNGGQEHLATVRVLLEDDVEVLEEERRAESAQRTDEDDAEGDGRVAGEPLLVAQQVRLVRDDEEAIEEHGEGIQVHVLDVERDVKVLHDACDGTGKQEQEQEREGERMMAIVVPWRTFLRSTSL